MAPPIPKHDSSPQLDDHEVTVSRRAGFQARLTGWKPVATNCLRQAADERRKVEEDGGGKANRVDAV